MTQSNHSMHNVLSSSNFSKFGKEKIIIKYLLGQGLWMAVYQWSLFHFILSLKTRLQELGRGILTALVKFTGGDGSSFPLTHYHSTLQCPMFFIVIRYFNQPLIKVFSFLTTAKYLLQGRYHFIYFYRQIQSRLKKNNKKKFTQQQTFSTWRTRLFF